MLRDGRTRSAEARSWKLCEGSTCSGAADNARPEESSTLDSGRGPVSGREAREDRCGQGLRGRVHREHAGTVQERTCRTEEDDRRIMMDAPGPGEACRDARFWTGTMILILPPCAPAPASCG
jgi:hypothetical protein